MTAAGDAMDRPSVEQRLVDALRTSERVEPSPDLWSRVVHSIDEDRAHRRQVRRTIAITLGTLAAMVLTGWLALTDTGPSVQVRQPVMEALETVALLVLVVVVGPAIRRFGRNYTGDMWRSGPETGDSLLRLLDVAYYLVFAGFIAMTVETDFERRGVTLGGQLLEAADRIGGLLLLMGLLHAVTVMVLPFVALISNSTRLGRPLPKWLNVALIVLAIWAAAQLVFVMMGVFTIGLGD